MLFRSFVTLPPHGRTLADDIRQIQKSSRIPLFFSGSQGAIEGVPNLPDGGRLDQIVPYPAADGQFRAFRIALTGQNDHIGRITQRADAPSASRPFPSGRRRTFCFEYLQKKSQYTSNKNQFQKSHHYPSYYRQKNECQNR